MPRGFSWCVYVDDTSKLWALQVDADYALDPDRGWSSLGLLELDPLPRGWRPRRVFGIDASGRIQHTVVAHVGAALWTGAATQFGFVTNEAEQLLATVQGRVAEFRLIPRPDE